MQQYPDALNAFITTPQRILLYFELTEGEWAGIFDPLVFFKLLDETVKKFDFYVSKKEFISVVNLFNSLPLEGEPRYFFLCALKEELDLKYNERTADFGFSCMDIVNEQLNAITKQLYPDYTPPVYKIDKASIKENAAQNQASLSDLKPLNVGHAGPDRSGKDEGPLTFKDIFVDEDWQKYIRVFESTNPPLLDKDWNFIGNPSTQRGIIGNWIGKLEKHGKIKSMSRQVLVVVLNNEVKGLGLGDDGGVIGRESNRFKRFYKEQLSHLLN